MLNFYPKTRSDLFVTQRKMAACDAADPDSWSGQGRSSVNIFIEGEQRL